MSQLLFSLKKCQTGGSFRYINHWYGKSNTRNKSNENKNETNSKTITGTDSDPGTLKDFFKLSDFTESLENDPNWKKMQKLYEAEVRKKIASELKSQKGVENKSNKKTNHLDEFVDPNTLNIPFNNVIIKRKNCLPIFAQTIYHFHTYVQPDRISKDHFLSPTEFKEFHNNQLFYSNLNQDYLLYDPQPFYLNYLITNTFGFWKFQIQTKSYTTFNKIVNSKHSKPSKSNDDTKGVTIFFRTEPPTKSTAIEEKAQWGFASFLKLVKILMTLFRNQTPNHSNHPNRNRLWRQIQNNYPTGAYSFKPLFQKNNLNLSRVNQRFKSNKGNGNKLDDGKNDAIIKLPAGIPVPTKETVVDPCIRLEEIRQAAQDITDNILNMGSTANPENNEIDDLEDLGIIERGTKILKPDLTKEDVNKNIDLLAPKTVIKEKIVNDLEILDGIEEVLTTEKADPFAFKKRQTHELKELSDLLDVKPADGQLNESSEQPEEPHNQPKKLLEKESGPKNDEKNMVGSNQTSIQYKDSSICGLKKPKDEYDIEIRRLSLDEMKTIDPKDLSQYLYTIILSKDIKDVSDLKSVIDPIQDIKKVGDMQWQGVITTNTKIMASGNAGRDFKLPEIMENTKVNIKFTDGLQPPVTKATFLNMTNVRHITSGSVHRVETSDNREGPLTSIQYENLPRKIEQSPDCPNCIDVVKVQRKRTRLLCDQCGINGSWRSSRTNSLPQKDAKKQRVENFVENISESKDLDLLLATISKKCNVVITMYAPKAEQEKHNTFEEDIQKQEIQSVKLTTTTNATALASEKPSQLTLTNFNGIQPMPEVNQSIEKTPTNRQEYQNVDLAIFEMDESSEHSKTTNSPAQVHNLQEYKNVNLIVYKYANSDSETSQDFHLLTIEVMKPKEQPLTTPETPQDLANPKRRTVNVIKEEYVDGSQKSILPEVPKAKSNSLFVNFIDEISKIVEQFKKRAIAYAAMDAIEDSQLVRKSSTKSEGGKENLEKTNWKSNLQEFESGSISSKQTGTRLDEPITKVSHKKYHTYPVCLYDTPFVRPVLKMSLYIKFNSDNLIPSKEIVPKRYSHRKSTVEVEKDVSECGWLENTKAKVKTALKNLHSLIY